VRPTRWQKFLIYSFLAFHEFGKTCFCKINVTLRGGLCFLLKRVQHDHRIYVGFIDGLLME
jgi:hypothetical protein